MLKVEYAKISIDQKLNHAWNCPIITITYRVSIFQIKERVGTYHVGTKVISNIKEKRIWPMQDMYNQ